MDEEEGITSAKRAAPTALEGPGGLGLEVEPRDAKKGRLDTAFSGSPSSNAAFSASQEANYRSPSYSSSLAQLPSAHSLACHAAAELGGKGSDSSAATDKQDRRREQLMRSLMDTLSPGAKDAAPSNLGVLGSGVAQAYAGHPSPGAGARTRIKPTPAAPASAPDSAVLTALLQLIPQPTATDPPTAASAPSATASFAASSSPAAPFPAAPFPAAPSPAAAAPASAAPAAARHFAAGQRVCLVTPDAPETNGRRGTVVCFLPMGRYRIRGDHG
jgi:hypothetical protein